MKFSIRYKSAIGLLFIFCISFNIMNYFINKIVIENNKKVISGEMLSSQRDINIYFKQYLMLNDIKSNETSFKKHVENIAGALSSKLNNRVMLYKKDGKLIFDTDYSNGSIYLGEEGTLKDNYEDLKLALKGKSGYKIIESGTNYIAVFSQPLYVDKNTLGILRYTKEYTDLFQWSNDLKQKIKILMFCIALFIFIFSILLTNKITIPIVKLSKLAKEISNGNFNINADIKSKDEIGELGESFNVMKQKINEQIKTIKNDRDSLIKLEGHRKLFFDNVTHEMKTPLTIIDGYAQMILDEGCTDEKLLSKAALKIKKESTRLHDMIIDILNMSKIESKVELSPLEKLSMNEIVKNICDDMSIKAKKYEITIKKDLEEDTFIFAVKDDIHRMLINIIDNSIKYGAVKSIINVELSREHNNCIIAIKDKGKGISKEDLNKIFEPFYRADKSHSREKGGNGLGLSIVKSIVDKYNGAINIESKVNEGTEVCIKIPLFLQVGNNLIK